MRSIIKASPVLQQLRGLDIFEEELGAIQNRLFNDNTPSKALWNAHCSAEREFDKDEIDLTLVRQELVYHLQRLEIAAKKQLQTHVHVPLNTVSTGKRIRDYGMASYPSFYGACRKLNFPSLDLLYQACDLAKVDCGHVYIHRELPKSLHQSNFEFPYQNLLDHSPSQIV